MISLKLKKILDAQQLAQDNRNRERVLRAIQSKQQFRHPAVFITFDVFRALGKMTS